MSHRPDAQILDQALAWHLRLKDADDTVWVKFGQWLDADPSHNEAYEFVAAEDERLLPLLRAAQFPAAPGDREDNAANDDYLHGPVGQVGRVAMPRAAWRWGALAASVAVAGLLAIQFLPGSSNSYSVETAPGETRTIAFSDGSEIMLNGGTKLALVKNDERSAELLAGEAKFNVVHDEAKPFTVIAGTSRLVDIGTVFNVVHSEKVMRVAVAEGAVRFEGFSRKIDLKPGDALSADVDGRVQLVRKPVASIGSWTEGALVYDRAPLSVVAEDLSRSLGVRITLPTNMKSQSFSGVIQTSGTKESILRRLEDLLDKPITAVGSNWTVQK